MAEPRRSLPRYHPGHPARDRAPPPSLSPSPHGNGKGLDAQPTLDELQKLHRQAEASLLCNRLREEQDFYDSCEQMMVSRPGAPQIYVVPGEARDRPDILVKRLIRTKIPLLAEALRSERRAAIWDPILETERLEYTRLEVFQRRLARDLFDKAGVHRPGTGQRVHAAALANHDQFKLHSFVVIQHDLDDAALHEDFPGFFRWYVNEFWGGCPTGGPQFLIFLNLIDPKPAAPPWWMPWKKTETVRADAHLQALFGESREFSGECPARCLKRLDPIDLSHVEHWVEDRKIFASKERAHQVARRIYAEAERMSGDTVRMDHVYDVLNRVVDGRFDPTKETP